MAKIPERLQWVFWSTGVDNLDLERNKAYIIHQVLAYGRMEEIRWLFQTYSLKEICGVFVNSSFKNYRPSRFNFVKNYILPLEDRQMILERYVVNTPRNTG